MPDISEVVQITITRETAPATRSSFGVLLIAGDSDKLPTKDVVTLTFDSALVASNSIAGKVDGVAITPVVWNATHDGTIADLITELLLKAGIGAAVGSDVGGVGYNNTVTCTATNEDTVLLLENFVVTLGASQPTITISRTPFRRTKTYTSLTAVAVDFATTDPEYLAASDFFAQSPNPGSLKIGRIDSGADWSDELDLIIAQDNDWYGLVITDRTLADQTDVAAWAETNKKMFFICSNSGDILNSGVSSDIASVVQTADYDYSGAIYHETAPSAFFDAGWISNFLSFEPGAATAKFKTITGFSASNLSAASRSAALAKSCNLYSTIGDRAITEEGTVGSGEFMDVIRDLDWLESEMANNIFDLLATTPKVPYTNAGIAQVEGEVRKTLDAAIAAGVLRASPDDYEGNPYRVTVKKVADISAADRSNRLLPDDAITFDAKIAGAIHKVEIAGTVSV